MKNIFLICSLIAFSQITYAQLSVGGSLAFGSEIENIGISAKGNYLITDTWEGSAGFTFFLPKGSSAANLTLWTVNFDGHYLKNLNDKFSIYPLAGLNISTFSLDIDLGPFGNDKARNTEIGLNLGGGVLVNISEKMNGFAEAKYVLSDFDQLVLNVGVLFGIGN